MLGDGDGRFLAALLAQNPTLTADAVDISAAMLSALRSRCERLAPNTKSRFRVHHSEALSYLSAAPGKSYDLVVTHFFLDCLTQSEVESLAAALAPILLPGALWLISDFRVPPGIVRYPVTLLIRSLYLAFRILTGLRTNHLPDHVSALATSFTQISESHTLFGSLTSELWIRLAE